jgi:hypothetical protein
VASDFLVIFFGEVIEQFHDAGVDEIALIGVLNEDINYRLKQVLLSQVVVNISSLPLKMALKNLMIHRFISFDLYRASLEIFSIGSLLTAKMRNLKVWSYAHLIMI